MLTTCKVALHWFAPVLLDKEGVVLMGEIHKVLRGLSITSIDLGVAKWLPQEDTTSHKYRTEMGPQLKLEVFFLYQVECQDLVGGNLVRLSQRQALRMLEEILVRPSSLF